MPTRPFSPKNRYKTIILLILFVKFLKLSSPPQSSLPSYALKVSKDGKDYDEQVSANIKEGSETFHLREASSGKDAGDIIYDLKRVIIAITLCVTFCAKEVKRADELYISSMSQLTKAHARHQKLSWDQMKTSVCHFNSNQLFPNQLLCK